MASDSDGRDSDGRDITLVVRRRLRATPERIFAAWTTPELLLQWWGPAGVQCTRADVDLRVGGSYRLDNRLPDGTIVSITGEFLSVQPPHELVYSWCTAEGAPRETVTLRLAPDGDHTELVLTHERIADEPTRRSHQHGWNGCLQGLLQLLKTPPSTT